MTALLILLLAALAGSFFWQPAFLGTDARSLHGFQALPAREPATTLSATAAALGGADFELLDDPDGERIARDLDLYAWYAMGANAPATNANPPPAPPPESTLPESPAPDADSMEGTSAQ